MRSLVPVCETIPRAFLRDVFSVACLGSWLRSSVHNYGTPHHLPHVLCAVRRLTTTAPRITCPIYFVPLACSRPRHPASLATCTLCRVPGPPRFSDTPPTHLPCPRRRTFPPGSAPSLVGVGLPFFHVARQRASATPLADITNMRTQLNLYRRIYAKRKRYSFRKEKNFLIIFGFQRTKNIT